MLKLRESKIAAKNAASRIDALTGNCLSPDVDPTTWQSPIWKLQVFVSSTFTDTMNERNILLDEILPVLKERGRMFGIEVVFIDMRYGVRDENTADHLTWISCYKELMECKKESSGIFFLSLQSIKYGYMPIPKYLTNEAFAKLQASDNEEIRSISKKWYQLDSNNIPPHYVLNNLNGTNDSEFWKLVLPLLRNALKDVAFDTISPGCENLLLDRSITDWEASCVMSFDACVDRCLWMRRSLNGDIPNETQDPYALINDTRSASLKLKLENLLARMVSFMGQSSKSMVEKYIDNKMFVDSISGNSSVFVNSNATKEYLADWKQTVLQLLSDDLNNVVAKLDTWKHNGDGVGMPGSDLDDFLHHCKMAYDKCSDFVGQVHLLNAAATLMSNPNRSPSQCELYGISMCVVGVSGAGKTALMSKMAQESVLREKSSNNPRPVIVRYCGTNAESVSGLLLMRSICKQIRYVYQLPDFPPIPPTYESCKDMFHDLLHHNPVILFIDSLDQLTNENQARSTLNFLQFANDVHPDTRIVVSCLPDEKNPVTKRVIYWYGCDTCLRLNNTPRVTVERFDGSAIDAAKDIFISLLSGSHRCITDDQLGLVLKRAAVEPTALYLRLASRQASKWKDSQPVDSIKLAGSVSGLIDQIYGEIERDFGEVLVSYLLSFITYSRNGLNVSHLEDLVSLSEPVIEAVFQYSKPNVLRIPVHVIIRVLRGLEGLIVYKDSGKISWYHRQLKESAERRYLSYKFHAHQLMGIYFGNIVSPLLCDTRLIASQPLVYSGESETVWFPSAKINGTRCSEGLFHLIEGKFYAEAAKDICSIDNICGYIKAGEGFHVVTCVLNLWSAVNGTDILPESEREKLEHYMKWLLMDMNDIVVDPTYQIFTTSGSQPICSHARKDCNSRFYSHIDSTSPPYSIMASIDQIDSNSWMRASLAGGASAFDCRLVTLRVQTAVNSVSFSHEGSRVVSGSDDSIVRILDGRTGELLKSLNGHTGKINGVCFNADDTLIASASSEDSNIILWDSQTGEQVWKLSADETIKGYLCVAISNNGKFIAAGASSSGQVIICDIETGMLLHNIKAHSNDCNGICVSPDSLKIASAGNDNAVSIVDSSNGSIIKKISGFPSYVVSIDWSPDGKYVATGDGDHKIKLFDTTNWSLHKTFDSHTSWVMGVRFSPDSLLLASTSFDYYCKIWSVNSGAVVKNMKGHTSFVYSVSFSCDGNTIATGSDDNTLVLWDTTGLNKLDQLQPMDVGTFGHFWNVTHVNYSHDGKYFISSSGDSTCVLWNAITGEMIIALTGPSDGDAFSACFNSTVTRAAAGTNDKKVNIWSIPDGKLLKSMTGHDGEVSALRFHPKDEDALVTGCSDSSLFIWNINATFFSIKLKLKGHSGKINCISFNSLGTLFATASADCSIILWSFPKGDKLRTLTGHSGDVYSVAFNQYGTDEIIASGSKDKTIKLWNTASGVDINTLQGHKGEVMTVAFSADGSRVLSGSSDWTIAMWKVQTGEKLRTLTSHSDNVNAISCSADGHHFVSASDDRSVRL
eukprot:gene12111-16216_t